MSRPNRCIRASAAAVLGVAAASLVVRISVPAAAGDAPAEMRPRAASWEEVTRDLFDVRWILPDVRTDPDADPPPPDLMRRAAGLVSVRFPEPEAAPGEPAPSGDMRPQRFADLVAACRRLADTPKARDAWLDRLRKERPDVWELCGSELLQLGRDEFLRGPKWDPDEDHDRDGVLHGKPFLASAAGTEPWTKVGVETHVQQAMTVFHADLEALKTGESDYAAYTADIGAAYEAIHAVEGSYVKGKDAAGRPFTALRVVSRSDLPFPYSGFECDLRILNRVGDDGFVRCDIWSPSRDFHWLAGQDLYLPLETSSGEFAGMLVTRVYGFDLDDVPDGQGNVRDALRSSLGNLKRRAEKAFATSGGKPRTLRGAVPDVVVRGVAKAK